MDNEIAKELTNQTSSVLDRAYDDAVHPSAVSIGYTASLIPQTVGVLLGRWKVWVVNGERNIDLAINQVAEKLEGVPEERLCEPAPNVVVPAIQQLSYSFDSEELRKLYVNLLATSMDRERRDGAHPSFVNLIGQMTPDEAKIMAWFTAGEGRDCIPIVDLRLVKTDEVIKYTWRPLLENYTNAFDGIVELPGNAPLYLDNLERLGLIREEQFSIDENGEYPALEQSEKILQLKETVTPDEGWCFDITHNVYRLTRLGRQFVECCVA